MFHSLNIRLNLAQLIQNIIFSFSKINFWQKNAFIAKS
jgi:hypothetical protein